MKPEGTCDVQMVYDGKASPQQSLRIRNYGQTPATGREATSRNSRQEALLRGSSSLLGKVVLSAACFADNPPHYKNRGKCSSDMVGRPINHSRIMSNSDPLL